MHALHIVFDGEELDKLVHKGNHGRALPQASDVTIATKDGVTATGRAVAVIAFDVQLPDGSIATAQAVTTVGLLLSTLAALRGRYGEGGFTPDVPRN